MKYPLGDEKRALYSDALNSGSGRPEESKAVPAGEKPASACSGYVRLHEETFRYFIEGAKEYAVFMLDLNGTIFNWAGGAHHRLRGYRPEEMIGKHHSVFYTEEDKRSGLCEQDLLNAEETGCALSEGWRIHKDGSRFWARIITAAVREESGKICGFLKAVYDITARRAAEESLRKSEKHFRSLIENSLDLLTVTDLDGTIVFQSHSVERFLGYRPGDVIGKSLFDFVHPGDLSNALDAFAMTIKYPPSSRTIECRLRHQDGSWHIVEAKALNLLDHPHIAGVVVNARDITERKRLEEQILKTSETEAGKIGQDLHESLSQQLVGLEFMVRVLEQKLKARSLHEESRDVTRIAAYLSQTIVQTRDLARELYPIGLELESFKEVLAGLTADIERQFRIRCLLECDENVRLDNEEVAMHAYQIVRQALRNAVTRGDVTQIIVGFTKVHDNIIMSVRDNGEGVARECLEKHGIGLHIMDHRAKMINGSLDIQPNASGGITVICSFPHKNQLKGRG